MIQIYKDMGLIKPTTIIQDGTIFWQGVRNYAIYIDEYENKFLLETINEYAKKLSEVWVNSLNALEYLKRVEESLEIEK